MSASDAQSREFESLVARSIERLLLEGEAQTLHEAEELYINAALPDFIALLGTSISNEELAGHPLVDLLISHGSRGWEDSLL